MAHNYLNELFSSFPSLVCDKEIVLVMLELLTVLRRSCLSEFLDEVSYMIFLSIYCKIANALFSDNNSTLRLTPFRPLTFPSLSPTITPFDNVFSENSTPTSALGSKLV